jgi:hypothetical protein
MPARRTIFLCGHIGRGKFCHRCQHEAETRTRMAAQQAAVHAEKQQWTKLFEQDLIDLRLLPRPDLVTKARQIVRDIQETRNYLPYKGKRLNHDRSIISVPLNHDYRILFQARAGAIVPLKVLSHEAYNTTKPGACHAGARSR